MSLEIRQIPLPYAMDALEPHLGARTLHVHYEKHHAGYVKKANQALAEQPRNPFQRLAIPIVPISFHVWLRYFALTMTCLECGAVSRARRAALWTHSAAKSRR